MQKTPKTLTMNVLYTYLRLKKIWKLILNDNFVLSARVYVAFKYGILHLKKEKRIYYYIYLL